MVDSAKSEHLANAFTMDDFPWHLEQVCKSRFAFRFMMPICQTQNLEEGIDHPSCCKLSSDSNSGLKMEISFNVILYLAMLHLSTFILMVH